jgi:hypothetical protein
MHGRCYIAFQIIFLVCYFIFLVLLNLKCGFADFPLIGMRWAPDNKVILRPLEQNLAPERCKKWIF